MTANAVVLAAGRGTRLGTLTADRPKPLLEVGGRPLIAHIVEGVAAAGVTHMAVVTGYRGEMIEAALAGMTSPGLELAFLRQQRLDGTARALALARSFVGGRPFLFSWGDVLVAPANYRAVVEAAEASGASLAVNEVSDPTAGAAVYVDAAMRIERIVEKPPPGTSSTRWNNAGFGVLPPAIWPAIDALQPSPRGEYELPQAIARLVADGLAVAAVPVQGPWFDVGTPEALDRARAAFAVGR